MSRVALTTALLLLAALAGSQQRSGTPDPHLDPSLVPGGCAACHEGHGESRSPMLPEMSAQP